MVATAELSMRECMTPTPHTIGMAQSIAFAADLMRKHGIRHLPVLHGGEVLGIVSDRDVSLLSALDGVDANEVTVEEAMTMEPYVVKPETKLAEVVHTMADHKYGAALVMEGNHVAGIFTTIDALRVLADVVK